MCMGPQCAIPEADVRLLSCYRQLRAAFCLHPRQDAPVTGTGPPIPGTLGGLRGALDCRGSAVLIKGKSCRSIDDRRYFRVCPVWMAPFLQVLSGDLDLSEAVLCSAC